MKFKSKHENVEENETVKKSFWKDKKNIAIVILAFLLICVGSSSSSESITTLENKIKDLTTQVENLTNENEKIQTENENLKSQIKELDKTEEINQLNQTISDKDTHIKNIEEQVNNLTTEKQNLESQVTTLTSEKQSLEQKVNSLSKAKTTTKSSNNSSAVATSATPAPASEPTNSYTVYITNTGSKYHSGGCSYLRKSKHAIDKNSAIAQGYSACSRCNP